MPLFPGQYDLLMVPTDLSYYLQLSAAEQEYVKQDLTQEIKNTIYIAQLQGWTYGPYKILADASGHKDEPSIQQELENLISGLGQGQHQLSINPDGTTPPAAPVELGYDKQYDCGLSCHHVYTLYIDEGTGDYSPWVIEIQYAGWTIRFAMRVSLMWLNVPRAMTIAAAAELTPHAVAEKTMPDRSRQALGRLSANNEHAKRTPRLKKERRKARTPR